MNDVDIYRVYSRGKHKMIEKRKQTRRQRRKRKYICVSGSIKMEVVETMKAVTFMETMTPIEIMISVYEEN